jgi:hypothetical protein
MDNTRDYWSEKMHQIDLRMRRQVNKLSSDNIELTTVKIITLVWLVVLLAIGLFSGRMP